MTINTNYSPTLTIVGDSTANKFPYNFDPVSTDFIKVYTRLETETEFKEQTTGWSLLERGYISFDTMPEKGTYVLITRETPIEQPTPYVTSSGFQAKVIENSLDRLTSCVQEISYRQTRGVIVPEGYDINPNTIWAIFLSMVEETRQARDSVVAIEKELTSALAQARSWAIGTISEQPQGSAKYWANRTHEELYDTPIEIADEILEPTEEPSVEPTEEPSTEPTETPTDDGLGNLDDTTHSDPQ